jgi:hypothetical protein
VLSESAFAACSADMKNRRTSLSVMCSHGFNTHSLIAALRVAVTGTSQTLHFSRALLETALANANILDMKFKFVRRLYSADQLDDTRWSPISVLYSNEAI